ncbi:lasso peptide biosynthesis PqqD family chaperone [Pseudofrankia asymbiotica]|nr:lasso peptide biosynthesis PqqD family chaperone [Pseudofrankia asymbiotica]
MLTLSGSVVSTDTDYGTALLDQRSGRYWTLNPTATLILRVLLDGGDPPNAARVLLDRFDVEPETARADVDRLVDQLRTAGLVTGSVPGTGPGAEPRTGPGAEPGTGPGAEPGTGPGAEPGTGPGAEPGAEPATSQGTVTPPGLRASAPRGVRLPFRQRPAEAPRGRHSRRKASPRVGQHRDDQQRDDARPIDQRDDRHEGGR